MTLHYNTRHTFYLSFEEQLQWKVRYQEFDDEEMVPCFKVKFQDEGLLRLDNDVFVRSIHLFSYIGHMLEVKRRSITVTQDISFNLFILSFLASINDTRTIIIQEVCYFINAKCKTHVDIPNKLDKWFKVKYCKKRSCIMRRLTVHLSKIGLQCSIFDDATNCCFCCL